MTNMKIYLNTHWLQKNNSSQIANEAVNKQLKNDGQR